LELKKKYKNIIVDNAGSDEKELKATMCVSDIVIFPLKPTQFDTWTVSKLTSLYEISKTINPKLKAFFIISQNSTNINIKEDEDILMSLKEVDSIKVLNTMIYTRIAYMKAAKQGLSVIELSDAKSRNEVVSLYKEIQEEYDK
jgi:chromosome partitioning protein